MSLKDRAAFLVMPIQWIWYGCLDREAARVAWTIAFIGRAPKAPRRRNTR